VREIARNCRAMITGTLFRPKVNRTGGNARFADSFRDVSVVILDLVYPRSHARKYFTRRDFNHRSLPI
jgi:hypothetical protein